MSNQPQGRERRRFFRIEDDVYLEVRVVTREQHDELMTAPRATTDEPCDLILQIRALASQAGIVLAGVRKTHPEIAQYLTLQDKKIELVARALVGKQLDRELAPNAHINVSGGGVAFHARKEVAVGTALEVRLVFFPSHLCVQAYGLVVHCEPDGRDPEKPFNIGVEFTAISDVAREALVRHTLERQSAELRGRRGR